MGKLAVITSSLRSHLHRLRQSDRSKSLSRLLSRSRDVLNTDMNLPELFCCFRTQEEVEEVKEVKVEQMPELEVFDGLFVAFVDELDLTPQNKDQMLNLPLEKKWMIYSTTKEDKLTLTPEYYVDRVGNLMPQELDYKLLSSLSTSLRTQPTSFVLKFLNLNGLTLLLNLPPTQSTVKCIKALMNNTKGRSAVLESNALNIISECLGQDCLKTKTDVFEILGAVCLVPGGHRKVLRVCGWIMEVFGERGRFQTIINDLDRSTGPYKTDINLKTSIMSFLNALLSYGPDLLEFRLHLRYELLQLGIEPCLRKLRGQNENLDKHLDFFEQLRSEDEREWRINNGGRHIDTNNIDEMFDGIKLKLVHSYGWRYLKSMFQHLLMIGENDHQYWSLIDRIVQQIVLQRDGVDLDGKEVEVDVREVCRSLAVHEEKLKLEEELNSTKGDLLKTNKMFMEKSDELIVVKREAGELKKDNDKLTQSLLALENKVKSGQGVTQRNGTHANGQHETTPPPPPRMQKSPKKISIPPPPPLISMLQPTSNGQMPPPPPLPPPMPLQTHQLPQKPTPTPSNPLKSFNWLKLTNINGTIWETLSDQEHYNQLNLLQIDKLFSKSHTNAKFTSQNTVIRKQSVIDSRRAQNCNILLTKLKLTDEEILNNIESINLDMLEQLLKFLPTNEEVILLEEQNEEDLARADAFLLKISKLNNFEQRLRVLHYKKRFENVYEEVLFKLETLKRACLKVETDENLLKLLEIVLAIGNYMNKGLRGNAYGFKLSSLNKLKDTKGVGGVNLMSYIAEEVSDKFVINLEELSMLIREARKVNLGDVNNEVKFLKDGLLLVKEQEECLYYENGVDNVLSCLNNTELVFKTCVKKFGEDSLEDFFIILDEFVYNFSEAVSEVKLKKMRVESDYGTLTFKKSVSVKKVKEEAEFDDLISALRSGDVFHGEEKKGVQRARGGGGERGERSGKKKRGSNSNSGSSESRERSH